MKDEGVGEAIRAICAGQVETRSIDLAHDVCNLVADRLGAAIVLVGRDGRHIERAMSKGSKSERAMTNVGLVREHYFQDCNIANDRRADRGDEEQDSRDEDEGRPDDMKPAKHDGGSIGQT